MLNLNKGFTRWIILRKKKDCDLPIFSVLSRAVLIYVCLCADSATVIVGKKICDLIYILKFSRLNNICLPVILDNVWIRRRNVTTNRNNHYKKNKIK